VATKRVISIWGFPSLSCFSIKGMISRLGTGRVWSLMMTTAFSMVIVTLDEGANAQAVCEDFEKTMDWRKWVCVAPSSALIAQKGNMVLCVMASGQVYDKIEAAAQNAGWTQVKVLENPDEQ